ncbi:MAG TPA: bifunctional hydroxymethylpyrimidine kinase/phosphomethylpyrimidine kinase [Turneriella sp.]|nr:bifunctional hydroxymethylpyrimidine kinase/phosphomethylpyrimidine kinase [Turneriella sp.]
MTSVALTIAGSDSGGGAGIQADLKTMAALGVFGTSAITAITAQNTCGVDAVEILSSQIVYAQIQSVVSDFYLGAVKTGMLGNTILIETVAKAIHDFNIEHLVVDTVMVSKSGHRLLAEDAEEAMRKTLLPYAYIVTPNIPEAEVLLGKNISTLAAMKNAAEALHEMGAKYVLVKGGHLTESADDVFFDGFEFTVLEGERIDTTSTHGTGCTLSAAIAAHLALGASPLEACRLAKEYLTGALRHAVPQGRGHGPVSHFWQHRF